MLAMVTEMEQESFCLLTLDTLLASFLTTELTFMGAKVAELCRT